MDQRQDELAQQSRASVDSLINSSRKRKASGSTPSGEGAGNCKAASGDSSFSSLQPGSDDTANFINDLEAERSAASGGGSSTATFLRATDYVNNEDDEDEWDAPVGAGDGGGTVVGTPRCLLLRRRQAGLAQQRGRGLQVVIGLGERFRALLHGRRGARA